MWCDDFDCDLPKVVPEAMPIVAQIPDSVILRTHSHLTDGKLNHPSCWHTDLGVTAFFTLAGGYTGPSLGWSFGSIAPPGYVTDSPIVACTFTEAVRDLWVHDLAMVVDGVLVWDAQKMWSAAFEPLMYHVRGWHTRTDAEAAEYRRRTCASLEVAVRRMQQLIRNGPHAAQSRRAAVRVAGGRSVVLRSGGTMRKPKRYAVLIVTREGNQSYVCDGETDQVSLFRTKPEAQRTADFWRTGLGTDAQSVSIVRHPGR